MLESFPDRGTIRFTKQRDAGGVMNAIVAFVRQNVRELLVGFFALVIPFALISGIGMALYFRQFGAIFADPTALENDPSAIAGIFGPSYFVLILGSLLAFGMGQAAVAAYVRLYREGESGNITVSVLWDEAKGLILPIIGMYALYMVAILLSGVIMIVPCLGIIAWMAFALWSAPYMHVMFASRMTESSNIGDAFARAKYLVKGAWAPTFGALALAWLLSYLVIMILSIPAYVILMAVMFNSVSASSDPTEMMGTMGYIFAPMQILGMAAYIVPALASFFVHGRLVDEIEGTSIDSELDIFETGIEATSTSSWDDAPTRPASGDATRPSSTPPEARPDAASGDEPPRDSGDGSSDDDSTGGFRGGQFGS